METENGPMIDAVWGAIDESLAREVQDFWAREANFTGPAARARLAEVVCVLRHGTGVAGVSSAAIGDVPLLAGRRFWIFRALLAAAVGDQWRAMLAATYRELDRRHGAGAGAPEGLCVLLGEDAIRADPAAEWDDPRMIYAGYTPDRLQVRVAYFSAERSASPGPERGPDGWLPGPGYRLDRVTPGPGIDAADIVEMWVSEAGLSREEAERRVSELVLVARDTSGTPVGAATAYLARNDQLQADMWYFRAFVREAHRMSAVAVALACTGRDLLTERFVTGVDRRGLGIVYEVENPGLRQAFPRGLWMPTDFLLIGENAYGAHVRVHYFPGAVAPPPLRSGN